MKRVDADTLAARGSIRALARGLEVIRIVQSRGRLSLAELHAESGIAKATLLRILATLMAAGFVRRRLSDGLYTSAITISQTSSADAYGARIAHKASTILQDLCRELSWPSDLSVFDGRSMLIVDTARHVSPMAVKRDVLGLRVSLLLSAMGRAYLAACGSRKQADILRGLRADTDRDTVTVANSHAVAREIIRKTRAAGYAIREPFVLPDGLSAFAVPVLAGDEPVAAMNLVWVDSAMTHQQAARRYLARVHEAAHEIGRAL